MGLKFRPKPGESVQIGEAFVKFGNVREAGQQVEITAPVQWIIKRTFPGPKKPVNDDRGNK